jgi:hypothetical protein
VRGNSETLVHRPSLAVDAVDAEKRVHTSATPQNLHHHHHPNEKFFLAFFLFLLNFMYLYFLL